MNLRRNIKAPRRYEDELVEEEATRPSPFTARANVREVERNLHLPPAAFPTLDPRQNFPRQSGQADDHAPINEQDSNVSSAVLSTLDPRHTLAHETRQADKKIPTNNHSLDARPSLPRGRNEGRKTQLPPVMASRAHRHSGPGNPIWEANMKKMEEWGKMTEEELIMAEMETSEDEQPPMHLRRRVDSLEPPAWETIPLALRIEMIYAVTDEENHNSSERAMLRLKLSSDQQRIMAGELDAFRKREEVEDRRIELHQNRMNDAILNGPRSYLKQDPFQGLYEDLDRPDTVVKRREVNDARTYMISCGLDTAFLDSWAIADNVPTDAAPELDDGIDTRVADSAPLHDSLPPQSSIILSDGTRIGMQEPSTAPTVLFTPLKHSTNGQIPVNRPKQTQPPMTTKRQITGETIEVDLGSSQSLSKKDGIVNRSHGKLSTEFAPSRLPQTPQRDPKQRPASKTVPVNRNVGWPQTPPTPSLTTLPPPQDTNDTGYEPKVKKQRPNIARKKPVPAHNGADKNGESPAVRNEVSQDLPTMSRIISTPDEVSTDTNDAGHEPKAKKQRPNTARKKPVSAQDRVDQNPESPPTRSEAFEDLPMISGNMPTQDEITMVEAQSSSAPTEQEIVVQVPGEQAIVEARQGGRDAGAATGDAGIHGTKPKKRGRPKK
ncbi:MAG: hypothetical protein Q9170_002620 [Blastenia crenularia]